MKRELEFSLESEESEQNPRPGVYWSIQLGLGCYFKYPSCAGRVSKTLQIQPDLTRSPHLITRAVMMICHTSAYRIQS
jgi:hypothetical protein